MVESALDKLPTPPKLYLQTVEKIRASSEDVTEGTSPINTEERNTGRNSAENTTE
jgi:hypothetical protein